MVADFLVFGFGKVEAQAHAAVLLHEFLQLLTAEKLRLGESTRLLLFLFLGVLVALSEFRGVGGGDELSLIPGEFVGIHTIRFFCLE